MNVLNQQDFEKKKKQKLTIFPRNSLFIHGIVLITAHLD
jgi:hypothetical protein